MLLTLAERSKASRSDAGERIKEVTLKTIVLAAVIASLTAGTAFAGTPWINKRQTNQWNRISNGWSAGQLNNNETTRLVNGQIRVQNMKTAAQSDGVVTFRERARIHTAQSVQGARIFWNRHH
jgi:uncharacterized membrane protein YebE (DUF533 family)